MLATPAGRRTARENNISLVDVQGTGRNGRVLKDDVIKFISSRSQSDSMDPGLTVKPALPRPTSADARSGTVFLAGVRGLEERKVDLCNIVFDAVESEVSINKKNVTAVFDL